MSELSPILLIEDDPRRLEATLQVLADLRLANRIEVARSEAEARAALERDRPGLVVVSIGRDSPGAAGLLADLRREARGPSVLALAPAVSVRELADSAARNQSPGGGRRTSESENRETWGGGGRILPAWIWTRTPATARSARAIPASTGGCSRA
ncbi:MAG: hypothetical protein WCY15_06890 [Phenylobacterium sp.]|uniref:hypothetical protein n=1 Tax=Phenylobacterium sp. TaxID=1871053 RepID=UPI002A361ACA|nr:hypothetical protein [Phenylobacterium sp.]MDX9996503.1 hypothetical protein [Phenylobacterium sp.]